MAEGFPTVFFFVDEDLTRADGVIRCQRVTTEEALKIGYRFIKLLRILRSIPFPPF